MFNEIQFTLVVIAIFLVFYFGVRSLVKGYFNNKLAENTVREDPGKAKGLIIFLVLGLLFWLPGLLFVAWMMSYPYGDVGIIEIVLINLFSWSYILTGPLILYSLIKGIVLCKREEYTKAVKTLLLPFYSLLFVVVIYFLLSFAI